MSPQTQTPYTWGLGRRKSAKARVRVRPGAGGFLVNDKEMKVFFPTLEMQRQALAPLKATGTEGQFDILCSCDGGGPQGQAEAVTLGIARALKKLNPGYEPALRELSLLTRDSRMKERKKYGLKAARRAPQFSKR